MNRKSRPFTSYKLKCPKQDTYRTRQEISSENLKLISLFLNMFSQHELQIIQRLYQDQKVQKLNTILNGKLSTATKACIQNKKYRYRTESRMEKNLIGNKQILKSFLVKVSRTSRKALNVFGIIPYSSRKQHYSTREGIITMEGRKTLLLRGVN